MPPVGGFILVPIPVISVPLVELSHTRRARRARKPSTVPHPSGHAFGTGPTSLGPRGDQGSHPGLTPVQQSKLGMRAFLSDLGYAARMFRKRPAFAITAIATLALGIGSTAAIFSVVNAVLLKPLPYKEPERLVHIWHDLVNRNVTRFPWARADFHDLRTQATMFREVAALTTGRQVIFGEGGDAQAEQIRTGNATPNLFRLLGARVVLGSDFADADGTPPPPPPPPAPRAERRHRTHRRLR